MATQAEIRQRVLDNMYGTFPTEAPFVTTLAASYTSVATSVTVADEDHWDVGDIVENTETGEQLYVTAVTSDNTNVLTVLRGFAGTTAAASVGTDDVLFKNPRFSQSKVDDAITTVLRSLELWGVYVFGNGSITRADPKEFYELAETDIIDHIGVLKVFEVDVNYEFPRTLPFRWQFSLGTGPAEYSGQGHGVHVLDWGNTNNTEAVYFVYAKLIDSVTDLMTRQEELVVVGASAMLLGGTVAPATHDPGARSDRTTAPGQTSRDVRYFQGRFFTEVRIEAAVLASERQKMIHENPKMARARRWRG